MTGALAYLTGRSTRNRLVRQLRRLRTPRYAFALLLGGAYLWVIGVRQRPVSTPGGVSAATVELLAAVGLAAIVLWLWLFAGDRRALAFSRAEVTWLFPAPLTRAQLIQYKLLRGQLVILFNVAIWTLLLSGGWGGAEPWRRAVAIWVLLTTLALHRIAVALLRTSIVEHGGAALRMRALTVCLVLLALTAVAADTARALPALGEAWDRGLREFLTATREAALRPVPAALLLPFRMMVRPLFAEAWAEWGSSMLPAVGILAAHYIWVIRSDAAFEESAAAAAMARHRSERRSSRPPRFLARPVPLLHPSGGPVGALLWKRLAAIVRARRAWGTAAALGSAILLIAALSLANVARTPLEIIGWLAAMWAGFLIVLGPQWVRNDLRSELPRLAVLRSFPVRGEIVVGTEAAGSAALLTAIQLGLVVIAYLAFWGGGVDEPSPDLRNLILVGAVAFLPAVNFFAMLIQNGAALLFPAWMHIGPDRPLGIEALGHNMLVMSGFALVLAALLLPPAAAGATVLLVLKSRSAIAVAAAGAAALCIAWLEARVMLARLGRVFEATDPAVVPPTERA